MRARLATFPASVDLQSTDAGPKPTLMARILRGSLGLVGLAWICFASTLCGCNSVNGYVMNESGKAYYRRGDYTAARHEFERALMDSPENPNYAHNVAAAMQQQGDAMAAEKMYQHALVIDPGHQQSYEGLAHLLNNNGRTNDAEQLLTSWAETQPYESESNLALARMYENTGNSAAAEESLGRALAANPRNRRTNDALGNHYRRTGRRHNAAHPYQNGLQQNPYSADFRSDAELLAQSQGMSPALLMAQQMPQYDPTFQPGPMPYSFLPPQPAVPTAPFIGSANIAQQAPPSIYPGTVTPAAGSMLPPSSQWGTPASVSTPSTYHGNAGMMAGQPAYAPANGQFFSGNPTPAWSAPMAFTPAPAPQYAPSPVMPAGGSMPMMQAQPVPMPQQPMPFQPASSATMIGQPPVVPAF